MSSHIQLLKGHRISHCLFEVRKQQPQGYLLLLPVLFLATVAKRFPRPTLRPPRFTFVQASALHKQLCKRQMTKMGG
jgi:hypothetical protein